MWERISGGCHTAAGGAGKMKYPCSDDWENEETGERVKTFSTQNRHISLPNTVGTLQAIYELEGVRPKDE